MQINFGRFWLIFGRCLVARQRERVSFFLSAQSIHHVQVRDEFLCVQEQPSFFLYQISTRMPMFVKVFSLSGEAFEFNMSCRAKVIDLKDCLCDLNGAKCSDMAILKQRVVTSDDDLLLNLVEDWFVIGDMLSPPALKAATFELTLSFLIQSKNCAMCGAPASQKCGGCRKQRYCSLRCQHQHWPSHKPCCC